jgi:cytochrome c-type biogenesis protein CcmH/NrfF
VHFDTTITRIINKPKNDDLDYYPVQNHEKCELPTVFRCLACLNAAIDDSGIGVKKPAKLRA